VKVSGVLGGEYDLPDLGVPPFYGYKGDEEATIFYHKDAVPADGEDPFQRCKEVDVVLTKRNENGHCLVTMEHYSSNFIHRCGVRFASLIAKVVGMGDEVDCGD